MTPAESPGCTFRQKANFTGIGIIIGVILAVLMFGGWNIYRAIQPSTLVAAIAPPAKSTAGDKKETKACTTIEAYTPKIKKKLELPESVQKDDNISVIATADTPRDGRPYIASALLNLSTGVGEIAFTPQPYPWLAFNRRGALGVAYGFKDNADGFVTRLYGRLDLMQVKRLHAGLLGDIDNAGGWYGGGFVEIRW